MIPAWYTVAWSSSVFHRVLQQRTGQDKEKSVQLLIFHVNWVSNSLIHWIVCGYQHFSHKCDSEEYLSYHHGGVLATFDPCWGQGVHLPLHCDLLSRAVTTMRHLRQLPPRSNQEVQCSVQTLFWPQSHALTFYFTWQLCSRNFGC